MTYICKNPVVMIVFNRPKYTEMVFEQVRAVKPSKLYIISDGPRRCNIDDARKIEKCQLIFNRVDWDCDVIKIYATENLGCKKRVITGLNQVFEKESNAIIIEDDCVPTEAFFKFCDWGLEKYRDNEEVGIISGSNLLDYDKSTDIDVDIKAGFSIYINCWGWATWKRTWDKFDPYLSIQEMNRNIGDILKIKPISQNQKYFWTGVFRHSIYTRTIWDFYLQYFFFKYSLVSAYPKYNLVKNIGFGDDSTHTHTRPDFVKKSWPVEQRANNLIDLKDPNQTEINVNRDRRVIKTVYGYSVFSTYKLWLGNILRYLGIIK